MDQNRTRQRNKKGFLNASPARPIMLFLLLCAGMASSRLLAQDLNVTKGSSTKVNVTDGVRKITLGSDKIIDAREQDDGHSVLVVGLAEGSSDLRIERLQGPDLIFKVAVRSEFQGMTDQMHEMLSDVPGLKIRTVGNKIVFDGKVGTQADLDKIKKVEAAFAGVIIDLVSFDLPEMAGNVKRLILADLHEMGVDSVSVEVTGDTAVLDGVVNTDAEMTRSIEKAKMRIPNVKSLLRVRQEMIETDLQFAEVDRETGSSFGQNLFDKNITLSPSYGVANTGRPGLSLNATATYNVDAELKACNGKSIYQEHISGASGQEVAFKQGGTVYCPGLPAVPYGVIIKVKPSLQGNDTVMSDVSVEITAVVSTQGQVTTREFKTSTSVMSKVGETVVLSGFGQALGTDGTDKTPILSDIPLLNLLFSNKSKSKTHKEAVLLLTPRPSAPEQVAGPAFSAQTKAILDGAQSTSPD